MQEKAIAFERLRGAQRMQAIEASVSEAWDVGALASLREAIAAQGQQARVTWADALSASVRPVITHWFMALYCAAKTAVFVSALEADTLGLARVQHSVDITPDATLSHKATTLM